MGRTSKAVRGKNEPIPVVEVVKEITKPPVLQDDGLSVGKLTDLEYMHMQLIQAKMEVQRAVKDKLNYLEVELGRQYQEQRDAVRGQQLDCVKEASVLQKEHESVVAAVNARLGFDIKNYTIRFDGSLIPLTVAATE